MTSTELSKQILEIANPSLVDYFKRTLLETDIKTLLDNWDGSVPMKELKQLQNELDELEDTVEELKEKARELKEKICKILDCTD
jgi:hypothetical protein